MMTPTLEALDHSDRNTVRALEWRIYGDRNAVFPVIMIQW